MVDQLLGSGPPSHHRPIGFSDAFAIREALAKLSRHVGIQCKSQYATGCLIKPVHGKNALAQLVAQGLQHDAVLAWIKRAWMDQPACGFRDYREAVVEIEDR